LNQQVKTHCWGGALYLALQNNATPTTAKSAKIEIALWLLPVGWLVRFWQKTIRHLRVITKLK
jgi:hypothetical protein